MPDLEMRSTREVAELLGVPDSVLADACRRGLIPEVQLVGGARVWRPQDVAALRSLLTARRAYQRVRDARRPGVRA